MRRIASCKKVGSFNDQSDHTHIETNAIQYDRSEVHKYCLCIFRSVGGCLATLCWRGFGDVVDSSVVLTASGFGYPENQSFEQTPHNVTVPSVVHQTDHHIYLHSHTLLTKTRPPRGISNIPIRSDRFTESLNSALRYRACTPHFHTRLTASVFRVVSARSKIVHRSRRSFFVL